MKKHISGLILVACLSSAAIVAASPKYSDAHYKGKGHHGAMMLDKIPNLTDEQKVALKDLREQRKSMAYKHDGSSHNSLMNLDSTMADYQQQVEALAEQAAERARARVLKRAEMHSKLQAILTEDQFEALKALKLKRRAHKHNKRGAHKGRRVDKN